MAYIRTVAAEDAVGELQKNYEAASTRSGHNALKLQSLNPRTLSASANLSDALMYGESRLSRAEREMIAVVVSSANNSFYGVHAHALELRKEVEDEALVTALQTDYRAARVDERVRAILDFAVLVTKDVHLVSKVSIQELLYGGLSEEEVLDIVQITAFLNYENRLLDALGVDSEDYMPKRL